MAMYHVSRVSCVCLPFDVVAVTVTVTIAPCSRRAAAAVPPSAGALLMLMLLLFVSVCLSVYLSLFLFLSVQAWSPRELAEFSDAFVTSEQRDDMVLDYLARAALHR